VTDVSTQAARTVRIVVTLKPGVKDWDGLVRKLDGAMSFAGMPNVWWMPIQTRTEMLATGVRSPLGVLVLGPDTKEIDRIGAEIEAALRDVPGTRSAFSERIGGGYFLDFDVDRDRAARYGLNVGEVEDVNRDEVGAVWAAVANSVRAIKAAYRPDGLNMGANLGRVAGAGIPGHFHVHVLPRWSADTNFMTTVAEARVLPEALPSTLDRLKGAWPK